MKSLVVVLFAGLVLVFGNTAPAAAGTPCWRTLINDWFDGRIDHTYPRSCYTQALQHLPSDVKDYSNAREDIQAALLASLRHHKRGSGGPGPPSSPNSSGRHEANNSNPVAQSKPTSSRDPSRKGVILRAIEWLGPSDAASIPLPLLILAGVAFLLLATAGGSVVARRLHERRLPPPPA